MTKDIIHKKRHNIIVLSNLRAKETIDFFGANESNYNTEN